MEQLLKAAEQEVKFRFQSKDVNHDIYHLKRVLTLASYLQEKEGGDGLVTAISAFLHDIHRMIGEKEGKYCFPRDSLVVVQEILEKIRMPSDKTSMVLHCIEFHEEYVFSPGGKSVNDIETLILQDADNLDAIGAIGIARGFAYAGKQEIPIWLPELPLYLSGYDESKDDRSEVHHFFNKLLRLKDNMNTETAKRMALERHKFIELFLKEFFAEWRGEK